MKSKKITSPKSKIIIILAIVAVVLLTYVVAAYYFRLPPFATSNVKDGDSPTDQYVNMDKTDTEQKAIKDIEDNPDQKTQNNQNDTPAQPQVSGNGKKAVNVLLTNTGIFNGKVSASGVVTDIAEQGGTCTYTFSNGSAVITKTSATLVNPTSTTCETVSFSASELTSSGTWKVEIKYSSSSSEGTSNSKEFVK